MTQTKTYLALFAAVIILGGGAYLSQKWFAESVAPIPGMDARAPLEPRDDDGEGREIPAPAQIEARVATLDVLEEIIAAEPAGSPTLVSAYAVPVLSEGTVQDAMLAFAATSEFSFSGRSYAGLGFFVEEIGGRRNENGNYWFLYVNGESSQKGASQTRVAPGDVVEWRYKKSY